MDLDIVNQNQVYFLKHIIFYEAYFRKKITLLKANERSFSEENLDVDK